MFLIHNALNALKWSVFGEIASRTIGPVIFLVLARLLGPEDFGVAAAATVIISFSQLFSDAGLAKALIQRQDHVDECANVAFWINVSISLATTAILLIAAPVISALFSDNRITPVLRVMSMLLPMAALSSVHIALFQKRLNFKPLFWVRLITTSVPGLVSLYIAMLNASYWALVAGALAGQLAQTVLIWKLSRWRPHWAFDFRLSLKLWSFGKWILLEGLLGWFYIWADSFLIGIFLSTKELGFYQTGNMFVLLIFSLLMSPIQPIIFSAFSQIRDESFIRTALLQVQKLQFLITLPIGIGLFVLQSELNDFVFNVEWNGIGIVIGILGLMHGLSWLMGSNTEAFKALNRPDVFAKIMLIGLTYYLPAYLFALNYGLVVFLWVRISLFILSQVLHFLALSRVMKIHPLQVFENIKVVLASACLYVPLYFILVLQLPSSDSSWVAGAKLSTYAVIVSPFVYFVMQKYFKRYRNYGTVKNEQL